MKLLLPPLLAPFAAVALSNSLKKILMLQAANLRAALGILTANKEKLPFNNVSKKHFYLVCIFY